MKKIKAKGEEWSDTSPWRTSPLPRLVRGELLIFTSKEVITNNTELNLDCRPPFETPQKDGNKRGTTVQTPTGSLRTGKTGKKRADKEDDGKDKQAESSSGDDQLAIQVNRQLNVDPLPRRENNRYMLLRPEPTDDKESASENEEETEIVVQNSRQTIQEKSTSDIVTEQVVLDKAISSEAEAKERAEVAMKERKRLLELPASEEAQEMVNGIPTSVEPGNFGRTMFVAYIPAKDRKGEVPRSAEQIRDFQRSVIKHMAKKWGLR